MEVSLKLIEMWMTKRWSTFATPLKSNQCFAVNWPLIRSEDLTHGLCKQVNGPFPSCCLSWLWSESLCSTIVREMSLICIRRNSFLFKWLSTRTHFETEACSNSEMGYLLGLCVPVKGMTNESHSHLSGFVAQQVEHCTDIAEVTGLNPVEAALIFQVQGSLILRLEPPFQTYISFIN